MICSNRVESGRKKLLKSKKVGVVKVVFSFLAFLCFLVERKPCLTNFSEKLKARKANKELLSQILRNFTEGNSRHLIRNFPFSHLKSNYVIRIGTRQDRYVGMRKFSNHAVLSMSDSTMAVSSKYTQDLSVQMVSLFLLLGCNLELYC